MSIFLATIQLISIILITLYEYKKKYLSVFLWATLLVMFGIPHFLSVILDNVKYSNEVMIDASIFVLLFNLTYILSRILFSILPFAKINLVIKKNKNNSHQDYFNKNGIDGRIKRYLFLLLVSCIVILSFFIIKYLGNIFNTSWGRIYILNSELGILSPLRFVQFLFFASAGVILVFKENKNKVLYIISVLLILFYPFVTGNRITILPLLVAIIIPFVFNNKRRKSFKTIISLGILGIVSVYLVYFLRLFRIYGGFYSLFSSLDIYSMNNLVIDMLLNGNGELGLRNAFYYFIDNNNHFPNFNEGHTYLRLLFIAIPTSLSGGLKPPDFAISMGSAWINDFSNTNISMHPTLYGDVFANFWWFGIFLGIFWAVFNFLIDKIVNRKNKVVKNVLLVILGAMFVIIARGSVYNGVFIGLVSSFILLGVYLISKVKFKN